jgi:hypothetical protein
MDEQDKDNGNKDNGDKDKASPEFGNFQRLLKQVVSTPKEKIDERRTEDEREKKGKQAG